MGFQIIEDHSLHSRYLNENSLILDLGGNQGTFSQAMVERFNCQCVIVEPSPKLFSQIKESNQIKKYNLAITNVSQPVNFNLSDIPVSSSLIYNPQLHQDTITVQGKRLDELVSELGWQKIDLIKMDIEGVEIDVLNSCSDEFLKSIAQLTVEFHDHVNFVDKPEIEKLINRFESLGFLWISRYLGCYYDTWLINTKLCQISQIEYLWLRHIVRNWWGLKRRIEKIKYGDSIETY
ncbi:FkbM family methyltransferase [Aphanothece hegewaldii CCALA 016]|uniref:FkbM family methyltransferase n=1 Tax=Aphanothece hegewaldii CCALA 016 TaxID=2107694 RepID=A0A2T1LUV8_9CHRO|nr:FkbM family methyltransferase [Aphanothece hegewaldii]PSF35409.1 FkbM family methyltransferase [Aphanothece hegewaldii CCALA 016]